MEGMTVWVVTKDEMSYEGLEGAFDVFVGVATSPLDALAIVESDARVHKYDHRLEINTETGEVKHLVVHPRGRYVSGVWVHVGTTYESHDETWNIREVPVNTVAERTWEKA